MHAFGIEFVSNSGNALFYMLTSDNFYSEHVLPRAVLNIDSHG